MLISLLYFSLLVLGGFILVPGEAVLYYVKPVESTDHSDCPGEPCLTLQHYVTHEDSYFSEDKVYISMIFLPGNHTANSSIQLHNLEIFEMLGNQTTSDVIVCLSIDFTDVDTINIDTIVIAHISGCQTDYSSFKVKESMNTQKVSILHSTLRGFELWLYYPIQSFDVVIEDSTFKDSAKFRYISTFVFTKLNRTIGLVGCTFYKADLHIQCRRCKVTIQDSKVSNLVNTDSAISVIESTVQILGNVSVMSSSQTFLLSSTSNVTISGNALFANNMDTVITAYSGSVSMSGCVSFHNNTGTKGGAMALYSSILNIERNTRAHFDYNSATDTGGALYVGGMNELDPINFHPCFYHLLNYSDEDANYSLSFEGNRANKGGEHIYGAHMQRACIVAGHELVDPVKSNEVQQFFKFDPGYDTSLSAVSSNPTRVCLCSDDGKPQCANISHIIKEITVCPGDTFTLPAVVVGGDFGTTTGTVHANFKPLHGSSAAVLKPDYTYAHWITSYNGCTNVKYSVYSKHSEALMYLTAIDVAQSAIMDYSNIRGRLESDIGLYHSDKLIGQDLLTTPVFIDITLLPCPLGFTLVGEPPGCDCAKLLSENNVTCIIANRTLSWTNCMWLNVSHSKMASITDIYRVEIADYCSPEYCKMGIKLVNFQNDHDSDAQCAFNHTGRLCGGCKENYSLAIGSSHCIHCPNNNNLALLIFFAAAGFLLVFFISALNLTVTQGMINGLIFYANIVWIYRVILFPHQSEANAALKFFEVFVAWLNLDFGIELCLVIGLNAFWRTLLQYVFPFYVWGIAGVMIFSAKYSVTLTKLVGNRAVPILATLFLLSYIKILRTIVASFLFTNIKVFNGIKNHTLTVWSLDGNHLYCHYPHVLLFIAALAILVCLWLPYTLLLLLVQWLRRLSHFKVLRWITRFNPVYDAYLAPLKHKHHYWFGTLLLVRGILFIMFLATSTVYPRVNMLLLQLIAGLLICYMNYKRVFKKKYVQILENLHLFLLILVGGTASIETSKKYVVVYISTAIAFLTLCGIILWNLLSHFMTAKMFIRRTTIRGEMCSSQSRVQSITLKATGKTNQFRDSILDENSPLTAD